MPYSVLQPVQRRRRRPRRGRQALVLLVLAAVVAVASLGATRHWELARGKTDVAAKAPPQPRPHRATAQTLAKLRSAEAKQRSTPVSPFARATPLLTSAPPRLEGRLTKRITAPAAILVLTIARNFWIVSAYRASAAKSRADE